MTGIKEIKTAEELVEENFKGLSDFIKDKDILHHYKGVIVACIEDYNKQILENWISVEDKDKITANAEYLGKEFGTPFEQIVYWATHSGWRYCQGGEMCGNELILKMSHFNSMVNHILKVNKQDLQVFEENDYSNSSK